MYCQKRIPGRFFLFPTLSLSLSLPIYLSISLYLYLFLSFFLSASPSLPLVSLTHTIPSDLWLCECTCLLLACRDQHNIRFSFALLFDSKVLISGKFKEAAFVIAGTNVGEVWFFNLPHQLDFFLCVSVFFFTCHLFSYPFMPRLAIEINRLFPVFPHSRSGRSFFSTMLFIVRRLHLIKRMSSIKLARMHRKEKT